MDIETKDIQKNEVIAMRNIYEKEFKLLRPKKKNIYEPPMASFVVEIKEGDIPNVKVLKSIKVLIDCDEDYPKKVPKLSLIEVVNINPEELSNITQSLIERGQSLLGTEMMHGLVEECRQCLYKSIESQVQIARSQFSADVLGATRAVNLPILSSTSSQDRAKIGGQEHPKFEACRHTYLQQEETTAPKSLIFRGGPDKSQLRILLGACEGTHRLKHIDARCQMVFNTFSGYNISQGRSILVHQITLPNLSPDRYHVYDSNWLPRIREDLAMLHRLPAHPNVVSYLASRVQSCSAKRNRHIIIQYLTSAIDSGGGDRSLAQACGSLVTRHSSESGRLGLASIRSFLSAVVEGVRFLHERDVTYIKIDMDSIVVDKNLTAKITEYCIGRRFRELKVMEEDTNGGNSSSNINHCNVDRSNSASSCDSGELQTETESLRKGAKKYDILKIGRLAKELFFFGVAAEEVEQSEVTDSELADLIQCCSELPDLVTLDHCFLAVPPNGSCGGLKPVLCADGLNPMERGPARTAAAAAASSGQSSQELAAWKVFDDSSRILTEFEIICKLGTGAFGDVVKVRNMYDNQFYAIKRVKLKLLRKKAERRTMKEVQLLSSLNHENIVRYYATWAEEVFARNGAGDPISCGGETSSTEHGTTLSLRNHGSQFGDPISMSRVRSIVSDTRLQEVASMCNTQDRCLHFDEVMGHQFIHSSYSGSTSSDGDEEESEDDNKISREWASHNSSSSVGITTTPSAKSSKTVSSDITFKESSRILPDNGEIVTYPGARISETERRLNRTQNQPKWKYLMIQMELCEGLTLQKFIDQERLHLNERLIWRFVREIVAGLDHLHSKNMIHRDMKPSNIFIDSARCLKLGDLGLATTISTSNPNQQQQLATVEQDRGPVGTSFYICPEMMAHNPYSFNADIYSLGIIVFEMCHPPFLTSSERSVVLTDLRRPEIIFPTKPTIRDRFVQLIRKLLTHDPHMRPTSAELMKFDIIPHPEAKELELRNHLLQITKNPGSNLYKLLLQQMMAQTNPITTNYEMQLYRQSPFKHFIIEANYHHINRNHTNNKKHALLDLIKGDFGFFRVERTVTDAVESIFRSHGGLSLPAPLLHAPTASCAPNNNSSCTSDRRQMTARQPLTLLDADGIMVRLPSCLRANFVRLLMNNSGLGQCRRYQLGAVFRAQEFRGLHPRQLTEAVFDIVTEHDSDNAKLEILLMARTAMDSIFGLQMVCELEINDTRIFGALMDYFHIPAEFHGQLAADFNDFPHKQSQSTASSSGGGVLQSPELRHKTPQLSESQIQFLRQMLSYNGDLEEFRKFTKSFIDHSSKRKSCETLLHCLSGLQDLAWRLADLSASCATSGVAEVRLRPALLSVAGGGGGGLYRGLVFQLVCSVSSPSSTHTATKLGPHSYRAACRYLSETKVLASGGCYGSSTFISPALSPLSAGDTSTTVAGQLSDRAPRQYLFGVGLTLDLSTIVQCAYVVQQVTDLLSQDRKYHASINVLVEYNSDYHSLVWKLLTSLWANGVAAVMYDEDHIGDVFNRRHWPCVALVVQVLPCAMERCQTCFVVSRGDPDFSVVLTTNPEDANYYPSPCPSSTTQVVTAIMRELERPSRSSNRHGRSMSVCESATIDSTPNTVAGSSSGGPLLSSYGTVGGSNPGISTSSSTSTSSTMLPSAPTPDTSSSTTRYVFMFARARGEASRPVELGVMPETLRQKQSLLAAHSSGFGSGELLQMERAHEALLSISRWFQSGRCPRVAVVLADLGVAKLTLFREHASLRALRQDSSVNDVLRAIDLMRENMPGQVVEKNWKEVCSRIWSGLQEAVKLKISKVMLYSILDNNHVLFEIK